MLQSPMQSSKTPREIAAGMYLGILSRYPTADELKIAENYFQTGTRTNVRQLWTWPGH